MAFVRRIVALLAVLAVVMAGASTVSAQSQPADFGRYLEKDSGRIRVPAGVYDDATTRKAHDDPLVLVADGRVVIENGLELLTGASNITLEGEFFVRGPVQIRGATDITLVDVEITNPGIRGGTGVVVNRERARAEPSERIVLRRLYIHDTYDDAIRIGSANDVLVENVVAERIFDVPQTTCNGEKCHDDAVQVMGPSTGIVLRDNDLEANVILKTDLGDIEAELARNQIHDDHNVGLHLNQVDGTSLSVRLTDRNWIWNHPQGAVRVTGSPAIQGLDRIIEAPPTPAEVPAPQDPVPSVDPPAAGDAVAVFDDSDGMPALTVALVAVGVVAVLLVVAAGLLPVFERRRARLAATASD